MKNREIAIKVIVVFVGSYILYFFYNFNPNYVSIPSELMKDLDPFKLPSHQIGLDNLQNYWMMESLKFSSIITIITLIVLLIVLQIKKRIKSIH